MFRVVPRVVAVGGISALVALASWPSVPGVNRALGFDPTRMPEIQESLLSGFAALELGVPSQSSGNNQGGRPSNFNPRGNDACPVNLSSNIKVNQGCLNISDPALAGRGQAQNETSLAVNKYNTNQLVASQNDYRRGDGTCYSEYSTDGG